MPKFVFLTELNLNSHSGASFNRIIELSKALNSATGNNVYVSSLMMDNSNIIPSLINQDFSVFHFGEARRHTKGFFSMRYFFHKQKYNELKNIVQYFKTLQQEPIFIIYNSFSSFYDQTVFTKFLKRQNFKVLAEKNERALGTALMRSFPRGFFKRFIFTFLYLIEIINGFFIDRYLNDFDGFLTINENYKKFLVKNSFNKPICKIPILFNNESNVETINSKAQKKLNIGYFGTINFKRDRIGIILKAFYLLNKEHNLENTKLTIGGSAAKHEEKKLIELIDFYKLKSYVKFVGYLSNNDLYREINKQNIMIALRNNNIQGKYSFATKIAMYMHWGKIPLVSDVSDNSKFISHRKNGFLLSKTTSKELAKLLHEISYTTEETLTQISTAALKTAQKHFNYRSYVSDLKVFLDAI